VEVVNRRCAGLDVHKESISACVLISGPTEGPTEVEKGTFRTFTSELMVLKNWLRSQESPTWSWNPRGVWDSGVEAIGGRLRLAAC
jgi:hypothetical protein